MHTVCAWCSAGGDRSLWCRPRSVWIQYKKRQKDRSSEDSFFKDSSREFLYRQVSLQKLSLACVGGSRRWTPEAPDRKKKGKRRGKREKRRRKWSHEERKIRWDRQFSAFARKTGEIAPRGRIEPLKQPTAINKQQVHTQKVTTLLCPIEILFFSFAKIRQKRKTKKPRAGSDDVGRNGEFFFQSKCRKPRSELGKRQKKLRHGSARFCNISPELVRHRSQVIFAQFSR